MQQTVGGVYLTRGIHTSRDDFERENGKQQAVGYDTESVLLCALHACCSFRDHGEPCSKLWATFIGRGGYIHLAVILRRKGED